MKKKAKKKGPKVLVIGDIGMLKAWALRRYAEVRFIQPDDPVIRESEFVYAFDLVIMNPKVAYQAILATVATEAIHNSVQSSLRKRLGL